MTASSAGRPRRLADLARSLDRAEQRWLARRARAAERRQREAVEGTLAFVEARVPLTEKDRNRLRAVVGPVAADLLNHGAEAGPSALLLSITVAQELCVLLGEARCAPILKDPALY